MILDFQIFFRTSTYIPEYLSIIFAQHLNRGGGGFFWVSPTTGPHPPLEESNNSYRGNNMYLPLCGIQYSPQSTFYHSYNSCSYIYDYVYFCIMFCSMNWLEHHILKPLTHVARKRLFCQ